MFLSLFVGLHFQMSEALIVISGFFAGLIQWLPCGIGLAAHRYKLGGAVVRSTNRFVSLSSRSPRSLSALGQFGFLLLVLAWLCVFFGAMAVPTFVAKAFDIHSSSPFVLYALYANMLMAVVAFLAGPAIWRRIAL